MGYLPLLHNSYTVLRSWQTLEFVISLTCWHGQVFYLTKGFFHKPHWFSICWGKWHRPRISLQAQALGASTWNLPTVFLPLHNKGSIKKSWDIMLLTRSHTEEGVPQYKNIPKMSFLLRNLLVRYDPSCGTPLSGSYRWEAVMELLPSTTNLLRSHKVSHMHSFTRKHCMIHLAVKI